MSKLTKAQARKLKYLTNKVIQIERYIALTADDQVGPNPMPEFKRRKRELANWFKDNTEN